MKPQDFINKHSQDAIESMKETGVFASVTLAQAMLESGNGEHAPGLNFFGIKGVGPAGKNRLRTREERNGQSYYIFDDFRAYHNAKESFVDHAIFLKKNKRYAEAFYCKDAKCFAREIAKAGYATAHNYAESLIALIDRYDLTRFDRVHPTEEEVNNLLLLPVLKISSPFMRNAAVKSLQVRLNALMPNLKLEEDGIYGFNTEKAVRVFEAANGLRVDGITGPQVWRKVMEK